MYFGKPELNSSKSDPEDSGNGFGRKGTGNLRENGRKRCGKASANHIMSHFTERGGTVRTISEKRRRCPEADSLQKRNRIKYKACSYLTGLTTDRKEWQLKAITLIISNFFIFAYLTFIFAYLIDSCKRASYKLVTSYISTGSLFSLI